MDRFVGKTVLITGASSGIGLSTANRFAEEGADVLLVSRRKEVLEIVKNNCEKNGVKADFIAGDICDANFRSQIVEKCVSQFGKLDILVNAAGILEGGTLENTSLEQWSRTFELNVTAVFHLMQLALPWLKKTRGNIVNVSSVTGLRAFPGVLAYNSSKAAVDHLTRSAALELASNGIRVNAVNPGVVRTNLHKAGGMDEKTYKQFLKHSQTTHPLGRVGEPEEVAALIAFLASNEASWITGVTWSIDGGRAQTCLR